jgi:hypothetical protein
MRKPVPLGKPKAAAEKVRVSPVGSPFLLLLMILILILIPPSGRGSRSKIRIRIRIRIRSRSRSRRGELPSARSAFFIAGGTLF